MSTRAPWLLACDLDGTLIDEAGRPHAGLPEALASLTAVGVPLAVCSGRPLHAAQQRSERLGVVPRAFICYHGALVVDTATRPRRHRRRAGGRAYGDPLRRR